MVAEQCLTVSACVVLDMDKLHTLPSFGRRRLFPCGLSIVKQGLSRSIGHSLSVAGFADFIRTSPSFAVMTMECLSSSIRQSRLARGPRPMSETGRSESLNTSATMLKVGEI